MTGFRSGQSGSRIEGAEEAGRGSRERNGGGWEPVRPEVAPEEWPERRLAYGGARRDRAAPLARDAAVLGAGVDYLIGQQTTLGVAYTGQIGEHADTQAVRGNVSYRF